MVYQHRMKKFHCTSELRCSMYFNNMAQPIVKNLYVQHGNPLRQALRVRVGRMAEEGRSALRPFRVLLRDSSRLAAPCSALEWGVLIFSHCPVVHIIEKALINHFSGHFKCLHYNSFNHSNSFTKIYIFFVNYLINLLLDEKVCFS